jgi:hypothetical protein
MIRGHFWRVSFAVVLVMAGCNPADGSRARHSSDLSQLSPEQRDVQTLGREVFELVDRAVDYRGSHRGRPAISLKQMGVESLTPTTVRRILNVQREPLVTVSFRQASGREIISCRGDSKILEDASLNGRYTLMCTSSSGAQHPMEVVTSGEP